MYHGKTYLGIIPARGGSKRLANKCLLPLGRKPLVRWTLEAARRSMHLDDVILSSDSPAIMEQGRRCGAHVPFRRPARLATDTATMADVVAHVLSFCRERLNRTFDYLVLLQPTSPLRDAKDIDAAIELREAKRADGIVSVCLAEHPPTWSNTLPPDLSMAGFIRKDVLGKRAQELNRYYRLNGAIYICDTQRFLRERSFFFDSNAYAFVMKSEKSVDVDTELDMAIAAALLGRQKK